MLLAVASAVPDAAAAAAPPLAGKIPLVRLAGDGGHAYLTDLHFEELGGKPFLVGQSIDPVSGNAFKGRRPGCPSSTSCELRPLTIGRRSQNA